MAADLAADAALRASTSSCCGDAHLSNFGVFASPERRLIFDVNDFDETLPGPWEWDVKRLAASIAVAARDAASRASERERDRPRHRAGVPDGDARVRGDAATSRSGTRASTSTSCSRESAAERGRPNAQAAEQDVAKARTRDSMDALSKLTPIVDGEPRIVSDPPLIVPLEELCPATSAAPTTRGPRRCCGAYRSTLPDDRRVLLDGTASSTWRARSSASAASGTRAWIALLLGRDDGDPLFLQIKEAQASVLEAVPRQERVPERTASASSRDSG